MKIYTKESLINRFREIKNMGWVKNNRPGNVGGVGNTLEDLLEIEENNLPLPNAGEWELKCQRLGTSSLTTLFHMEPSPRALKFVPRVFLLGYGWLHKQAGKRYPENEMSFRQTINGRTRTDRGFKIVLDRESRKVLISFDSKAVDRRHSAWLSSVEQRIGNLNELSPQPYWGFDDLRNKAGTKLLNCFYILAKRKNERGEEFFLYDHITILQNFSFALFLDAIENGDVLIDFDARTGHNHGTKFRTRNDKTSALYKISIPIE
jgi:hypothetical protein